MTKHERDTYELHRAAAWIVGVSGKRLIEALSRFEYWQNEWQNSIPRDSRMKPCPTVDLSLMVQT